MNQNHAEGQVTSQLEHTAGVGITSEEVRWRMERTIQSAAASGFTLSESAIEFNKALQLLQDGTEQSPGA